MNLISRLRSRGGVSRTSVLYEQGHTPRELRAAVERGRAIRPRRGWIALADADPALLFAARHGVVLSCISQAKRLGLWVLDTRELHVAAPHRGSQVQWSDGVRHWARPMIPRSPGRLEDPVENVLSLVADCQPKEAALAVLDSALHTGLVTIPGLELMPLSPRLRALLRESTPFADSGLETLVRTRLSWLKIPIRAQSWILGHRVDLLIGDRLVVQLDGRQHEGHQRDIDNAHDAALRMAGYTVLRFGYVQVLHGWHRAEAVILDAIARGMHLKPEDRGGRLLRIA